MIVIACLEAIVILAIVVLFLRDRRVAEDAWTQERSELLTRIQHPQVIPAPQARDFTLPAPEQDEIDLVGVVQDPSEADLQAVG